MNSDGTFEIEPPVNLPAPPPTLHPHDRWLWPRIAKALDEAGIALVPKPKLIGKGHTKRD